MIHATVLSVLLALCAAAQDKAAPSPFKVTATLDRSSYALGDEIQVSVKLENVSDAEVMATELTYEARSLSFGVKTPWEKTKEYTLAVVRPDPHVKDRLPLGKVKLGRGESLVYVKRLPTIATGSFSLTARYAAGDGFVASAPVAYSVSGQGKLFAAVEVEGYDKFKIELRPQDAPANVTSFVDLARRGFYNDSVIHRVVKGSWIHGGCPYGLGIGGPGYATPEETSLQQGLGHEEGTVALSVHEKAGYHGSQFFICLARLPALDGKYTIIGKVPAENLDAVKVIGKADVDKMTDRPRSEIRIKRLAIEVQ